MKKIIFFCILMFLLLKSYALVTKYDLYNAQSNYQEAQDKYEDDQNKFNKAQQNLNDAQNRLTKAQINLKQKQADFASAKLKLEASSRNLKITKDIVHDVWTKLHNEYHQ